MNVACVAALVYRNSGVGAEFDLCCCTGVGKPIVDGFWSTIKGKHFILYSQDAYLLQC